MKNVFIAAAVFSVCLSSTALAQLSTRCFQDDQLVTIDLARGRNAWARKCGLITASREAYLNTENEYQVFTNGCFAYPAVPAGSSCSFHVPADEASACITGLNKLGTCVAGCTTPTQKVAFDGRMLPIPEAYASGVTTVTALSPTSEPGLLRYGEQTIRSYVAGDTQEDIFALETKEGRRLEVTAEHPMVLGDGTMVKARTLQAGDTLMGADGKPLHLTRVTVFSFKGQVWNVRPESQVKLENVMNAEGFLTGSVRFQNEWAQDDYRLSLRDEVDVGGL
ncbi:Hint domain-containing protein [Myxococcus sp. AB025B]|uniref:Hint domain-containing protein n=1 Tax=Myxococcus sp. AB025B TaxID=2562794 RepID=UPI001891491C|nr:Hint domain-containing protein [Myxococcus sp. AB025B]